MPPSPRSFTTWITLLFVWSAGLVMWAVYLMLIAYLWYRVMM